MAVIKQLRSNEIYKLKIELGYIEPVIWRRFSVESDIKLPDLHKIIQTVMGWTNSHLHQFRIKDRYYSAPYEDSIEEESMIEYTDYTKIKLNQVIKEEQQFFYYDYDFGDDWSHKITVEKIEQKKKGTFYPVCLDGERNCPPEDCGGTPGYEDMLQILQNPDDPEFRETMDWLGGGFDSEEFESELINELLEEKNYGCISIF